MRICKKSMRGKIISVVVIALITVSLFPKISGDLTGLDAINEINENQPLKTMSGEGLIDNVITECYGTYLTDIPLILLGIGVNYIRIEQKNYNEIPVYIDISVELKTHNGKVLTEFDHVRGFQTAGPGMTSLCLFTRYDWKYFNYRFGYFDITLDVTIREDGSHETLLFNGFVYGCGAVIFNPAGEKLE